MMTPLYRSVAPCPELARYVRRYMIADCHDPVDLTVRPGPTGCNYLSWLFSGKMTARVDGVLTKVPMHQHYIAGQIRFQDIEVQISGRFGHIVAEFEPAGLYELLHLSPVGFCGAARPVPAAAGLDLEQEVEANLSTATGSDWLVGLDRKLSRRICKARTAPPGVSKALDRIQASGGETLIRDLPAEVGMSERNLTRRFKEVVGVTPKYFARVVQLNRAIEAIQCGEIERLAALAHDLGFYDQPHFNRTIQSFLADTPGAYLNGANRVLREFLGAR